MASTACLLVSGDTWLANSGDTEGTEFRLARLGDPDSPHRLETVDAVGQLRLQVVEKLLDA